MVVNQCDCADDLALWGFRIFADEVVANQVAESLRAVGVTALRDEPVELPKKAGVNRHAYSAETAHGIYVRATGGAAGSPRRPRLQIRCCGAAMPEPRPIVSGVRPNASSAPRRSVYAPT